MLMTPPFGTKFAHGIAIGIGGIEKGGATGSSLRDARSPVSFREGRRASDTVMAQGAVFRQRLRGGETVKARGVAELRKEMESLMQQGAGAGGGHRATGEEMHRMQCEHQQYQELCRTRQRSLDESMSLKRYGGYSCPLEGMDDLRGAAGRGAGPPQATDNTPLFSAAGGSRGLHHNILQNRLQQILQRPTSSARAPNPTSELYHVSMLQQQQQQLQQLHLDATQSPSSASYQSDKTFAHHQQLQQQQTIGGIGAPQSITIIPANMVFGPDHPSSIDLFEVDETTTTTSKQPLVHHSSTSTGGRGGMMRTRHFTCQSSFKGGATPIVAVVTVPCTDEPELEVDLNLLHWQPVCDLAPPQLSPTFEETNEEVENTAKESGQTSPESMNIA